MRVNRRLFLGIIFTILLGAGLFFVPAVKAQLTTNDLGLNYAANIGLGTRDIRDTIVSIIQIFLGFLGLIALAIVLYGGFLYLTSGGDAAKIEKAKKLLINAGIGLVIIVSAYGITAFVFRFLTAGQVGPGGTNGTGGPGGGGFVGGVTATYDCPDPDPKQPNTPFVCKVYGTPNSAGGYVRIKGGKFGSSASLGKVYFVAKDLGVNLANGQINTSVFATCTGTNPKCLPAQILSCGGSPSWLDDSVKVIVPSLDASVSEYYIYVEKRILKAGSTTDYDTYYSATKDALDNSQGGFNALLTNKFTLTSEVVPSLGCVTPVSGPNGTEVTITGNNLGSSKPATSSLVFYDHKEAAGTDLVSWSNNQIRAKVPAAAANRSGVSPIYVKYRNGAGQDAFSSTVDFSITCGLNNSCGAGALCVNGLCELQKLPAGAKCGIVAANACTASLTCDFGLACDLTANPSSTNDTACGACSAVPTITGFSPADGAVGSFVTIYGLNFGTTAGHVYFKKADGTNVEAFAPASCKNNGAWTDKQIIVEVPVSAVTGIISVQTSGGKTATSQNLDSNSVFTVNNLVRPGLCSVYKKGTTVNSATFNDEAVYTGQNFDTASTSALLSGKDLTNVTVSSATVASGTVPNLEPSSYLAQVQVGGVYSNAVGFSVTPAPKIPKIDYLDIVKGPSGQYVSIYGSNFEDYSKSAKLSFLPAGAATAITSSSTELFNFPSVCAQTKFWSDTNIIFKVPEGVSVGAATVEVTNSDSLSSNTATFSVCALDNSANSTCKLTPGVCKIEPNQGPAGLSDVKIFGEGFDGFLACPANLTTTAACSAVNFFNNQLVTSIDGSSWSDSQVGSNINIDGAPIVVPANAKTGPVQLLTKKGPSNSINFTVADCRTDAGICTDAATTCCQLDGVCKSASSCKPAQAPLSNLNYKFLTGTGRGLPGLPVVRESKLCVNLIQSPSPYLDAQGSCVNAQVSASFVDARNTPVQMEATAFNSNNIRVFKCGKTETFDVATDFTTANCPTLVGVKKDGANDAIYPLDNNSGFIWQPGVNYDLNTWYVVQLVSGSSGIRSVSGLALDGDRNGIPGHDYVWAFRVGNDPTECQVGKVDVLPDQTTTTLIGDRIDYQALAMAQNCQLLDSSDFDWSWQSSRDPQTFKDASAIAKIVNYSANELPAGTAANSYWRQRAESVYQGVAYVGATPRDPKTGKDLAFNDLNNRFVVDLKIPEIYSVYHSDGLSHPNIKNYVRITGKNFGATKESSSDVLFGQSTAELAQCGLAWSDNETNVREPVAKQVVSDSNKISLDATARQSRFELYAKSNAVAAYNFNEDTGPTVKDLVSSGSSNDATLSDNVSRGASPVEGKAATMVLPAAVPASAPFPPYIKIPADGFASSAAGTIEFWFKADNISVQTILSLKSGLALNLNSDGSLAIGSLSTLPGTIKADTLYHLAYVVDANSSKLYLNGVLDDISGTAQFINDAAVKNIYLGGSEDTSSGHFAGLIDNFAIYNKTIGQDELMAHAGLDPQASGLVGLFDFEGEGITYADSSANNLTIGSDNNPARTAEGYFGQGADFNLSTDPAAPASARSQFLKVNAAPEISFNQNITVSAWIKPFALDASGNHVAALSGTRSIISSDVDGGFALLFGDTTPCGSQKACFRLRTTSGDFVYAAADKALIKNDQWNFVAGTYDGKNINLYINGNQAGSFAAAGNYLSRHADLPVCLGAQLTLDGANYSCNGSFFSGTIDQAAIYNRALSAQEISNLYGLVFPSGQAGVQVKVVTGRGQGIAPQLFTNSNKIYPYLCSVDPNQGPAGTTVNLTGENFGDSNVSNGQFNGSTVFFDLADLSNFPVGTAFQSFIKLWKGLSRKITLTNPYTNHTAPSMAVKVRIDPDYLTDPANPQYVNPNESETQPYWFKPVIQSVTPNKGPRGQWITITGYNFGPFRDKASGNIIYNQNDQESGGVYFSGAQGIVKAQLATCGDDAWTNTSVTVEVPANAVTGAIFLRSTFSNSTNLLRLDSNTVNFTVTTDPVGAGLCPILPPQLRGGMNAILSGTRFGEDQGSTKVQINQSIDLAEASVPDVDWNDQEISLKTATDIVTGLVQVIKQVQTGQTCQGLTFGNFCPSGKYVPVIASVPSNAQPINVLSGAACDGGNPGTTEAVETGWPKNIFYEGVDNAPIELGNMASDGTYVYARAWLSNTLAHKPGFIAKIGTGHNGTDAGRLYNWYLQNDIHDLDQTQLDQTSNLFFLNGELSYVANGTPGNYLRTLKLSDNALQPITSPADLDPNFLSLGRQFYLDADVAVANPFLAYPSTDNIGAAHYLAASVVDDKGVTHILNLGATSSAYILRDYNPADWTFVEKTINAPESRTLAVGGIMASDQYLYLVGWQGESDIINWRGKTPAFTPSFQERYQTDNINTREISGYYDQENKEIYMGELADNSVGYQPYSFALPNDLMYRYARCGVSAANFCTADVDCKHSREGATVVDCAESVCNTATNLCSPVIREITPSTSPIGSWVTIKGCQLGEAGQVNFNGSANPANPIYNRPGLALPNYCMDTYQQNHIVVEVPKVGTSDTGDDAVDGPIQLVRDDGSVTTTVDTGSASTADQAKLWYHKGGSLIPEVCNLIPVSGDIGDGLEIRGRRFGAPAATSFATFVGNEIDGADDRKAGIQTDCPAPAIADEPVATGNPDKFASWSDKRICAVVPDEAVTGAVEVTTHPATVDISSKNKIGYTVFTKQFGPQLISSIAADQADGICRNSAAMLVFDQPLQANSVNDSIKLYFCKDKITSANKPSLVRELWSSVLRLLGVASEAQVAGKDCNRSTDPISIKTTYELAQGVARVQVIPAAPLEPGARYQIEISNTLKGENGIGFNRSMSSQEGSSEADVQPKPQSQVTFDTLGTFHNYDSGICAFGDAQVTVFALRDEAGEIRGNDNFFCSGDSCDLDFDFDQLTGTPNNQHRYVAHATSENPTDQKTISDNFDRAAVSAGADNYNATSGCTASLNANRLTADSTLAPCSVTRADLTAYSDRVTASIDLLASNESKTFSYGLAVGGILAYREEGADGKKYFVIEHDGKKDRSQPITSFAVPLTLTLVYDGGSGATLKADGVSQLTVGARFNPALGVGLYTKATNATTKPLWDNLKVITQDYNYLKASYSWQRNDTLDPLRLVNLNSFDATRTDKDKVDNDTGEVFTDINPIAQGNTKIAIRVGSGDGLRNNVIVKPFPINIFICQNPWISHNFRFTSSVLNFISTYCRDAGDIKDLSDDLPSAGIINTEAVQNLQSAINLVSALQQQVSALSTENPINGSDLQAAQATYQAALSAVNALVGADAQQQTLLSQLDAINTQLTAINNLYVTSQALSDATGAVTTAEIAATTLTNLTQINDATSKYNAAKVLVDALPAGSDKDALESRLATVKNKIDAASAQPAAAGIVPDLAAASDAGLLNTDNITNDSTPTFIGACTTGLKITIKVDGTANGSQTCASGNYSITTGTLADGQRSITMTSTSQTGVESSDSPALSVTIDTSAPSAPTAAPDLAAASDIGISSSDNLTADNTPTFTGSCTTGEVVNLYIDGAFNSFQQCAASAYSFTTATLGDGVKSIQSTFTDLAGNESAKSASQSVTIDTAAPSQTGSLTSGNNSPFIWGIQFNEPLDPSTVNSTTFTLKVNASSTPVAGTVAYDTATNTATFMPSSPLEANIEYAATVSTGIKDLAGNSLASNFSWSSTVTAPSIAASTMGLWKFDETSGTVAADSSGKNHPATFGNVPAWGNAGYWASSKAVQIDATHYASTPKNSDLNSTTGVTVDAWVKPITLSPAPISGAPNNGSSMIIDDSVGANNAGGYTISYDTAGRVSATVRNGTAQTATSVTSTGSLTANVWNHVAFTYSPANKQLKIYVNGALQGTTSSAVVMDYVNISGYPFQIGAAYSGSTRVANAYFDNIGVYNRLLSDSEVASVFALQR